MDVGQSNSATKHSTAHHDIGGVSVKDALDLSRTHAGCGGAAAAGL